MRLVCPNCGAQYEVDDRVIPEGGRDVQCSACGHGWYQVPAGHQPEVWAEEPTPDETLDETQAEEAEDLGEEPADEGEAVEAPAEDGEAQSEPEAEEDVEKEPEAPPAEAPPAREMDESVRSILQDEAQRELEARADEAKPEPEQVETQPDLGLDDGGPSPEEERRRIARERMARMRGLDEEEPVEADFDANVEPADEPEKSTQGRDLFPDIEEINSTLDSHAPGVPESPASIEAAPKGASGFGRGFTVAMVLVALLISLYLLAPKLAANVPALEPVLAAYVEAVNSARAWLDETLRGLTTKIQATTGEGG